MFLITLLQNEDMKAEAKYIFQGAVKLEFAVILGLIDSEA